MIDVYAIEVEKTITNRYSVTWSARRSSANISESVDDYNFKILWSFDPVVDFVPITNANGVEVVIDGATGPFYVEHYIKHTPFNREHYYKIRTINKLNPSIFLDSKSYYENDDSDGVIKTIVHAERMLNNNYIGEPVYILKRKTDGARCPQCWNPYQFKRTLTHCPTCRGTGFYDGFFAPIVSQVSFERNPKIAEVGQTGEVHTTTVRGRLTYYPLVTPRDMIVAKDSDMRYTITRVDYTKLPNLACKRSSGSKDVFLISQMLTLAELPPDDDKYNVVIGASDIRGTSAAVKTRIVTGHGAVVLQYKRIRGTANA